MVGGAQLNSSAQVVNGDLFEQRFNDLRRKRDRDDDAGGRPFSRMHKYYSLLSGNRWAKVLKLSVVASCPSRIILHDYHKIKAYATERLQHCAAMSWLGLMM